MSEALTRRNRPIAIPNPNFSAWVLVGRTTKAGMWQFCFNLTPAAAEELARELTQRAKEARTSGA